MLDSESESEFDCPDAHIDTIYSKVVNKFSFRQSSLSIAPVITLTMPETFRQFRTTQDGLDNLHQTTAELPKIKNNEVLVKIHTVSLNYRDTEGTWESDVESRHESDAFTAVCMGTYGHHKSIVPDESRSLVPCSDMCGTIQSMGSEAAQCWKNGQRVLSIFNQSHLSGQITATDMGSGLGLPLEGVLAEYRAFDMRGLVAVPDYLTDEEACTLPIAAVTAWTSMNWMRPVGQHVQGADTVVLLQGTGGVAIAGLQIAKASGLTAIITSSSDEKLEKARALGADHTVNYRTTPDWHEQVMKLTDGKGADIILETGGAETLSKSFECVAFGGLISAIGYLSGKEDAPGKRPNMNVLALKRNVTFKGILNGPKDRFEEMLELYASKEIRPVVDRVFKFDESRNALKYLYSGNHLGKVVIKVA